MKTATIDSSTAGIKQSPSKSFTTTIWVIATVIVIGLISFYSMKNAALNQTGEPRGSAMSNTAPNTTVH